jgi:hypothetical protein
MGVIACPAGGSSELFDFRFTSDLVRTVRPSRITVGSDDIRSMHPTASLDTSIRPRRHPTPAATGSCDRRSAWAPTPPLPMVVDVEPEPVQARGLAMAEVGQIQDVLERGDQRVMVVLQVRRASNARTRVRPPCRRPGSNGSRCWTWPAPSRDRAPTWTVDRISASHPQRARSQPMVQCPDLTQDDLLSESVPVRVCTWW